MKTIRRNSKRLPEIFNAANYTATVSTLENNFSAEPCSIEAAKDEFETFNFVKLREGANGSICVRVHSNCWYDLTPVEKVEEEETVVKFKVGTTYATRSVCNQDSVFKYKVVKRSAKFIYIESHGEIQRRGIFLWDGKENCKPEGTYSMCPVITAGEDELLEGGEIKHEAESRAKMEEMKAIRKGETVEAAELPQSREESEVERNQFFPVCDHEPLPVNAHEAVELLLASGHKPHDIIGWPAEQTFREVTALKRRSEFYVV